MLEIDFIDLSSVCAGYIFGLYTGLVITYKESILPLVVWFRIETAVLSDCRKTGDSFF